MTNDTMHAIRTMLTADRTVTDEQTEHILRACRQEKPRRKLIGAREAQEILQVSRPTLRAYASAGLLHQINFSSRKVRFDENEVYDLAYYGKQAPEQMEA